MGTLSNTFWKSRRMASVCIILSIMCERLSMSWISCVSLERCFLNPCCASWRMLCLSRCCLNVSFCLGVAVRDGVVHQCS